MKQQAKKFSQRGSKSMTTKAYTMIKEWIIKNEIEPGTILSENKLANELNMSRTPIRDAINMLKMENLVETYNGIGVLVKNVSLKEAYELYEVRAALEGVALKAFINNIEDNEIEAMLGEWLELKNQHESANQNVTDKIIMLDQHLHQIIIKRSDNAVLENIMAGIREKIFRLQSLSVRHHADDKNTINQHIDILKAMKERDIDQLTKELRDHALNARDNLINNLKKQY
ncbi:MAG: GntR family transcriptional regulator [Bacillota bacterium]|nr:GntR family transcriptional regulator [Bacillota bacterium]